MDHKARMLRAVNAFGWGGIALSIAVALLQSVVDDQISLLPVSLWGAANVLNMSLVTALPRLLGAAPGLRAHLR